MITLAGCGIGQDIADGIKDAADTLGDSIDDGVDTVSGDDDEESNDSDSDAGEEGEVVIIDDDQKGSNRYFLGTFTNVYDYDDCSGSPYKYNLGSTLRLYSHNGYIDLENPSSGLVGVAEVFLDDTFDFVANYYDSLGRPNVELVCTCDIDSGYYPYLSDSLDCQCETNEDVGDGDCSVSYEKIS